MNAEMEAQVLEEIRQLINGQLEEARDIRATDHLIDDLGLDSLDLTVLAVGLEDRFRVRLSEEDSDRVTTVAELASLVARRAAGVAS